MKNWWGAIRQWLLSVLHNCIVHPLMPFVPSRIGNTMHDVTATWAFPDYDDSTSQGSRHPPDDQPLLPREEA